MPLNPKIRVASGGIHGMCWWANEDIPSGEWLWKAGEWDVKAECIIPIEVVHSWPIEEQERFMALAYQINEKEYSGFPSGLEIPEEVIQENYVNHTCDGNCWYVGDHLLIAKRDIKAGEEIAYDYALTEGDPQWQLNCKCGTKACRGLVTGNDWQKKELQEQYGDHFLPYILDKIKASKQ